MPKEVEAWLHARMGADDTTHLIQVPSIPVGWTAGKWGDGFLIADVEPEEVTLRYFRWRPTDRRTGTGGEEAIDSLEPFRVTKLRSP